MNSMKKTGFASTALIVLVVGFWGCGHDDMNVGDARYGQLEPFVTQMNSRLASHYGTVQTALFPQGNQGQGERNPGTEAEGGDIQAPAPDPDWDMVTAESEEYASQMLSILSELGGAVSRMDSCRMMMGGRIAAPGDSQSTCPCEPYMDASADEVDRHHAEMTDWLQQRDATGLWEEMTRHMEEMGARIRSMDSHMRMTYGGAMMGGGMH